MNVRAEFSFVCSFDDSAILKDLRDEQATLSKIGLFRNGTTCHVSLKLSFQSIAFGMHHIAFIAFNNNPLFISYISRCRLSWSSPCGVRGAIYTAGKQCRVVSAQCSRPGSSAGSSGEICGRSRPEASLPTGAVTGHQQSVHPVQPR